MDFTRSIPHSWGSWIFIALSFPMWTSLLAIWTPCCVVLGERQCWQSCSYLLQCIHTLVFVFFSNYEIRSPITNVSLLHYLSCPWIYAQVSTLQVFPDYSWKGWSFLKMWNINLSCSPARKLVIYPKIIEEWLKHILVCQCSLQHYSQ